MILDPAATPTAAIIGAGPAGLIAAEILATAGVAVTICERMPSPGRRLLMAGRGGLNLTHAESLDRFVTRYGAAREALEPLIRAFPPQALRDWANGLAQETFTGSSNRVFPKAMKASPLLRAWLARLGALGVRVLTRHEWCGWDESGAATIRQTRSGEILALRPDVMLLALGGASWPGLGAYPRWADLLAAHGVAISPLRPANCGFLVAWSETIRERYAGQPLKTVEVTFEGVTVRGDMVLTGTGIEGGAVYALSSILRDAIGRDGSATLHLDLRPDSGVDTLTSRLAKPRGKQSLSNWLRKAAGLVPVSIALLREAGPLPDEPQALARFIKACPVKLTATAGIERAISSAGGVPFEALDAALMLHAIPGTFVAGEMLDWEAPTGGYLLQASFATGVAAAHGMLARLERRTGTPARA